MYKTSLKRQPNAGTPYREGQESRNGDTVIRKRYTPLMRVAQLKRTTGKRRRVRVWTALIMGLLAAALLIGSGSTRSTGTQPEAAAVPTLTATSVRTLAPTTTSALPPTPSPTPAHSPTFTPTPLPLPTFTPTVVASPTLIPMSALSITPEAPTAQEHAEPIPTVVSDGDEGQAGAVKSSADTVPQRIFVGELHNQVENREGRIRLEVQGNAVYAILQTIRSPVQHFARQQPEVLFTIPEGFRPATSITWEVNGQHVGTDGQLDASRSGLRVFRLRVDTEGHVRYVDDPGLDGVGYLRYRTALAWPLAGTDPLVCERSRPIRQRILAALVDLGEGMLSCDQVDWEQLARVRTWSSQEPPTIQHYHQRPAVWYWIPEPVSQETSGGQYHYQERYLWPPFPYWYTKTPLSREYVSVQHHDLLGLTNLTELHVQIDSRSPFQAALLAHTPRLLALNVAQEDLSGWSNLPSMPRDFFAYTPRLSHLSLSKFSDALLSDWTVEALGQTPHLTSLHLGLRRPTDKVSELLQHVPQLARLTIAGLIEPLPEDFLWALPNLAHLTVEGQFNPCATAALRLPTNLTTFALRLVVHGDQVACLADNPLVQASALTDLSVDLYGLEHLETDVLPQMPALIGLTVDVGGVTVLPSRLLANLPNLIRLRLDQGPNALRANEVLDLPAGFLAGSPNLVELSLELPSRLHQVPAELLAPVPNLKRLRLDGPRLTTLPFDFLGNQSQLTDVSIELCDLNQLPDDFLVHTPQLKTLYLGTDSYRCYRGYYEVGPKFLPERILSHTPKLTHLWLGFKRLEELPPSFLAHVPRLQHLELEYTFGPRGKLVYALRSLPSHFLENAPNLTHVDMWPVVHLSDLPADFLVRSTQLQRLYLDAGEVSAVPDGFLTDVPHLQLLDLDLNKVGVLPDGFLAHTPQLQHLKLDVDQAAEIPGDFLAYAPDLEALYVRAANAVELPEEFLGNSPRLETLGLGMPHLASPLGPGDALWDTLQSTSYRVRVTDPDFQIDASGSSHCHEIDWEIELGDILEVVDRGQYHDGSQWLSAYPWFSRSVFFRHYELHVCSFMIESRHTEPTLDV